MPFVTDIYPPAREIEAVAGLGLAVGSRKGKGFPGRRQYEAIEVLGCFSVPLRTVTWDKGEEGCTGLVVDPQGLLTGAVRFDLVAGGPRVELKEDSGEEDFLSLCQQAAKAAAESASDTVEIPGLVVASDQVQLLLKDNGQGAVAAGMEQAVDAAGVVETLRQKLAGYDAGAAAWAELKQKFLAYRDRQAAKINEAADEARTASSKSLEELKQQVQSAIAARRGETEKAREEARQEHRKQKELLQAELERFQQQFEEKGEDVWRDKIKAEEQRLAENEKILAAALSQLDEAEKKFAAGEQERVKLFEAERDKRLAAFEQRLKRLDSAVSALEKAVDKRLERCREQHKKVTGLAVSLTAEQCEKEFPVVFYAARYPGERWQVFPPQLFGDRGIRGKVAGLVGGLNLPFQPATRVGEALAAKIQAMLPGHALETRLVEQNLLENPGFVDEARAGMARLIDQGEVNKKYANLFEGF